MSTTTLNSLGNNNNKMASTQLIVLGAGDAAEKRMMISVLLFASSFVSSFCLDLWRLHLSRNCVNLIKSERRRRSWCRRLKMLIVICIVVAPNIQLVCKRFKLAKMSLWNQYWAPGESIALCCLLFSPSIFTLRGGIVQERLGQDTNDG